MNSLVIGTGACGNKAAINLLERGIIEQENLLLINSTLKDIPEKYRNKAITLSENFDGCGKERQIAKQITKDAISSGTLNFNKIVYDSLEKVIIITSMEGGTGSGSTDIIAKHLYQKMGIANIEIFAFKGFEEDVRGIANSIEFFQDMQPAYGIQVIRNDAFLKEAQGNLKKAQKLANDELARRIKVSLGQVLVASEDNVDGTDLYKVTNTTGYSTIEYLPIDDKIKSLEEFNKIVAEMIDSTKSLSLTPSATRIAVLINLQESSQDNIDYKFEVIKDKLGNPYELFKHIQYTKNSEEFIAIIASGMRMPLEELRAMKSRYDERTAEINKSEDDFFKEILSLQGSKDDAKFDMMGSMMKKFNNKSKFSNTQYNMMGDNSDY